MKTRLSVVGVIVALLCCLRGFAASAPATLTFADLADHPDRWPPTVSVLANVRTKSGQTALQGQKLRVVNVTNQAVFVQNAAGGQVGLSPQQCDIMDAANARWSRYTPEQRALDVATILNDPSLWPDTVRLVSPTRITDAGGIPHVLPRGLPCAFLFSEKGDIGIVPNGVNQLKWFKPEAVDLIGPARERLALPANQRRSKIIEAVRPLLRDADGRPVVPASLDKTKVFVLFWGANWCGWCHKTSPELAKFVNQHAASLPGMTFVMLDGDKEPAEMLKYMKGTKLPWPGVLMSDWQNVPFFAQGHRGAYPQVTVCDRYGKLLYEGAGGSPNDIAAHLEALNKYVLASAK
jgi:thiol-disulfide isomerase/thioredoxin